ncbi:MAG: ABC transporter ATP-binding protein, partial [Chloroflexi bacterium]|nr:ABC transporter ATP-binding protein [Chloroflexota bacterium]
NGDETELYWLVGGMVAVTVASGVFNLVQAYLNTGVGLSVMRDLRRRVYGHLQKLSISFFTRTRTGDIQSRVSNDVASTELVLTDTISNVVSNVAVVISSVIAMLLISWELSLVALAVVPIFVFFTVRVGRKRRRLTGESQRALAELTARTGETLSVSGVMLAKTFGREQEQMERFEADNDRLTEISIRRQMAGRSFFVVVQTFFTMAPALVWLVGGLIIMGADTAMARVTIGDMVAFTTIQVRVLFPLSGLLNRGVDVTSSLALFDRIFEYLDIQPRITDPEHPVDMPLDRLTGDVRFNEVAFAYPAEEVTAATPERNGRNREPAVVTDPETIDQSFRLGPVSFRAEPGTLTALVGPSGSGKTTVGYLLSRLYDPDAGSVSIDNIDLRQFRLRDLGRMIGVVSQDSFLLHTSVRENLLYGKPDATQDEIVAAAKAAQIHDLVTSMPQGYETIVGERGYRLSGGERQRMAIARVMLKDPRILLLDEATSSLDTLSERLIQQALSKLMQGRTTVAIAHRLSTVIAAQQILVMQHGRIVERGTHSDLIESSELYRRLYEEQFTAVPSLGISAN